MAATEDYRARLYRQYSKTHSSRSGPATPPAYEAKVYAKLFGPLLPPDRKARILELGCGAGSFLHYLKDAGYQDIVGVEQDEDHVAAVQALGLPVKRENAVEHLRANPDTYDVIVTIDFLEHFRKDELFPLLDVMRSALRAGGTIIGRVPNADGIAGGRIRYGDLTHEIAFTQSSIHQLFTAAKFKSALCFPEEPAVTGLRSLVRWLLWQPMRALLRLYLFAESYTVGAILTPNLIFRVER